MVDALRTLQERVAVAAPPAALVADVTAVVRDLAARLEPHAVPERERVSGRLDVPGRGQTLVPAFDLHDAGGGRLRGTTRFGQQHLGGNAAVHGGVIPLMFDEVLGRLAGSGDRSPSRTAYLHVDYRNVTPLDTDLDVEAWFVSEEGRKRLLRATLHHGDTLCAEIEGLFVALLPGQP
ncbi:MAG: thioesterase [Pseudonocardia sp. 73-21]|nr:MAG: thioesterase [Pseudonocardia sp. 73-21]